MSIFVADPIFNLLVFVRVFSKALIVVYIVFPMHLMQITWNWPNKLRMDFLCFHKCPHDFFFQHHPSTYKILSSTTNTWNRLFYTSMEHLKLGKSNRVCNLNSQLFFLLALDIVSRNYKTKKILSLPCMHRYIFSLTLKFITTLLQKLAIFHIRNVKQKNDGMDQNTLYCCYDEYVATNQQT